MMNPRTLRGQLALAYAAALLVALIAFAIATLVLVDSIQRRTLDDGLQTATRAIVAIVDLHRGYVHMDRHDREQFAHIVGRRSNGAVIVSSGPIASTVVTVPQSVLHLATSGFGGTTTVRGGEGALRVSIAPLSADGRWLGSAVVWGDLDGVDDLDRNLAIAFGITIPIVAAFAVVAGGIVARRGLRPLVQLNTIASEIEAHDLSRRIAIPERDDELGRLCVTFDRMLDRLQAAFDRERRFTSDASHELRAPLSVIRAEADLMLRRTRTPEEYQRALQSIAAQADDLEALTRDLLAAARGEADARTGVHAIDVGAIASTAAERLDALACTRAITVHCELDPDASVLGNEGAMRRATICLLHNALKFARRGGTVDLKVERDGTVVRLSVADDGPGFSPEALAHATERFWRDDLARLRAGADDATRGGTGLGLSIAMAIATAMHGTLRTMNRAQGGALVALEFPAVSQPIISQAV